MHNQTNSSTFLPLPLSVIQLCADLALLPGEQRDINRSAEEIWLFRLPFLSLCQLFFLLTWRWGWACVCVCEARWYESSRTVALGPLFYYNRVVSGTKTLVLLLGPGSISASVCWLLLVSLKELSRGVAVEFICLSTIANKIFSNIISWK